jgi:hypothetical protein
VDLVIKTTILLLREVLIPLLSALGVQAPQATLSQLALLGAARQLALGAVPTQGLAAVPAEPQALVLVLVAAAALEGTLGAVDRAAPLAAPETEAVEAEPEAVLRVILFRAALAAAVSVF